MKRQSKLDAQRESAKSVATPTTSANSTLIPGQGGNIFSRSIFQNSSFREKLRSIRSPTPDKLNCSFKAGNRKSAVKVDGDFEGGRRVLTVGKLSFRQKIFGNEKSNKNNNRPKREVSSKDDDSGSSAMPTINLPILQVSELSICSDISNLHAEETLNNDTHETLASLKIDENKNYTFIEESYSMLSGSVGKHDGYVGFANLPNQLYRCAVKRGFYLNLMVVGGSGLGKSTLINSMFLADIYDDEHPGPSLRSRKTVSVETNRVLLKENGVSLFLNVIDTPGFGDAVDNSNCWVPIVEYIESKYNEYLNAETRVIRRDIRDDRVHCCLYFIAPSSHGLNALDIEVMRRLYDKVNLVPIIAKADSLTADECALVKQHVLNEITKHKIQIYDFPDLKEEEDDNKLQTVLTKKFPFAVIGSNAIVKRGGKEVRLRKYPWGTVEIENVNHCDFAALRNMLIKTHMQDLIDVTNNVHYENFRCRAITAVGCDGKPTIVVNKNPLAQMEDDKREHEERMKLSMMDMEEELKSRVADRRGQIQDIDDDIKRHEKQMNDSLEKERCELEEKRRAFEAEKAEWEHQNAHVLEELARKKASGGNLKESGKDKKIKKKPFF